MGGSGTSSLETAIGEAWARVQARKPLLHHITNFVVMNETANATLAVGALPVMAHAREEVEEMVGLADALVLNIGTLTAELVDTMVVAGRAANRKGIPVVFDPVGAGATQLRTEAARRILTEVTVSVLRGNAGEVATLAGRQAEVRGVESGRVSGGAATVAEQAARRLGIVTAVTGPIDYVSDGTRTVGLANGHPRLATVTGTGCMATTLVAAAAAVTDDAFTGAVAGLVWLGIAGENAAGEAGGPGSYHVALYDALAGLNPPTLAARARVEIIEPSLR
ncbi:MAG: hydroxyethylthiazole kinase [Thermoleophilia bacterium]